MRFVRARIRWPALPQDSADDLFMRGSIWYSVNMTLVWTAARHAPELAWDEWHRITLSAHTAAYPDIWAGTLSGPDSYLAPELPRAGRTWVARSLGVAMQAYRWRTCTATLSHCWHTFGCLVSSRPAVERSTSAAEPTSADVC